MRRFAAIAVAAAALVPAAIAVAGFEDRQFEGRIQQDPFTYMGLDVVKENGKKFVANGFGYGPYFCAYPNQGYTYFTTGRRIRVADDGTFRAKQPGFVDRGPNMEVRISGKVNGRRIKGSVGWRYTDGTATPNDDCYSGQQAFRVSKDTELDPPD